MIVVHLGSQHDLISVLLGKAPRRKLLRESLSYSFFSCLIADDREAQAKRGEEAEVDPDQFQDPDNEYGLFAGTTYEQDDEEADKIYEQVDENMDARRKARRCVLG